jgi:hypothetical protein
VAGSEGPGDPGAGASVGVGKERSDAELRFGAISVYKYYHDDQNLQELFFDYLHQLKMLKQNVYQCELVSNPVKVVVDSYIYVGFEQLLLLF